MLRARLRDQLRGVGGPRLVGLTAGVQLLYILPCFPPYDPGSLGWRLAGLTLAVLLLAGAELVVWPDPTPEPYTTQARHRRRRPRRLPRRGRRRLERARRTARDRTGSLLPAATDAAEALRPSRLPPTQRPASAGRRDRALTVAAGTARLLLGRTVDLHDADERHAVTLPAAAALLHQTASCARAAADWLRTGRRHRAARHRPHRRRAGRVPRRPRGHVRPTASHPSGCGSARSRSASASGRSRWSPRSAWSRGRHCTPTAHRSPPADGPLWFAAEPAPRLWWHRLREHLTPRSVYFQGALRLAVALAAGPAARRRAGPLARVLGAARGPHPAAHLGRRDPLDAVGRRCWARWSARSRPPRCSSSASRPPSTWSCCRW